MTSFIAPVYPVIGFSGKMGAGKTSCAKLLEKRGYERMRFAAKLKSMLRIAGLTPQQIDGSIEEKSQPFDLLGDRDPMEVARLMLAELGVNVSAANRPDPILMGKTPRAACELMVQVDVFGMRERRTTPRRSMQLLGTEWGRAIHPNLWTMLWRGDALRQLEHGGVAVDDVRFPNEVDEIHELGGILIQVDAPSQEVVDGGLKGHASETLVLKPDRIIFNDFSGMDELDARLATILDP